MDIGKDVPYVQLKRSDVSDVATSKTRWIILALFCLIYIFSEWLFLGPMELPKQLVTNIYTIIGIGKFWMFILTPAIVSLLGIPCAFLYFKVGLRISLILVSVISSLCAALHFLAADFPALTIIRQLMIIICVPLLIGIPPQLAAMWFPVGERAMATAIGVASRNVGLIVAVISIMSCTASNDMQALDKIKLAQLIVSVLLFMLILFMPSKPAAYPSFAISERDRRQTEENTFWYHLCQISNNYNFLLLCSAYGIVYGLTEIPFFYLDKLVLISYPSTTLRQLYFLKLSGVAVGIVGALTIGIIQDKTHQDRQLMIGNLHGIFASFLIFGIFLTFSINFSVFCCTFVIYFSFSCAFLTLGLEAVAEEAYPAMEIISVTPLFILGHVLIVIFTVAFHVLLWKKRLEFVLIIFSLGYVSAICLMYKSSITRKRTLTDSKSKEEEEELNKAGT